MDNQTLTVNDIITKVHSLVKYNQEKENKKECNINKLSKTDQILFKCFKEQIDKVHIIDLTDQIKEIGNECNLEFYSFMYSLFYFINKDFKILNSENKFKLINIYCQDFVEKIRKNDVLKNTPTFTFNKKITTSFQEHVLVNDLILFMSIFFNINIFVIENLNNTDNQINNSVFYTMNETFNKYKHTIFLLKSSKINLPSLQMCTSYCFIELPDVHYDLSLHIKNFITDNTNILIYQQEQDIGISKLPNNKVIKITDDNDIEMLNYDIMKNKENKSEKKSKKIKKEKQKEVNDIIVTSEQNINAISINDSQKIEQLVSDIIVQSGKYKEVELKKKKLEEIKELAKSHNIPLTEKLNTGKTKPKSKAILMSELLKIN